MIKLFFLLLFVSCSTKQVDTPQIPEAAQGVLDTSGPYAIVKMPGGKSYHTGLLQTPQNLKGMGDSHVRFTDCGSLPEEFDLRTVGTVPATRNQGQCGSCWSFSKTGSLESALLGQGIKVDLAMQELVSCDTTQYGCEGGLLSSFKYQIDHGQALEKDFPYTSGSSGRNGSCKQNPVAGKGVSFQYVGTADRGPTEDELKCALFKYKTVPWITVGATGSWGSPPSSEKTAYTSCGRSQTNHAVGVVGWWKDSRGKTQFIMKNSWGASWGDKGYMSLPLGCNSFGEEVAFIEVEKSPVPPVPPAPPPPCSTPKVKLPAEVQVFAETEVMLGVKAEAATTYSWTLADKVVGSESMLYVTPAKDAVYKLSAKNSCAVAESQVRVRIVMSK